MLSRSLALIAFVTACFLAQALPSSVRLAFIAVNLAALLAFRWDKLKARVGGKRIPAWVLHALTLGFGAAGAGLGRWLFRHKTLRATFSLVSMLGIAEMLLLLKFLS